MAIIKCSCVHEFQDKKYGKGRRVHNPTAKGDKEDRMHRCTVCGQEKTKKGETPFTRRKK